MIIGVDVDSVVADLIPTWLKWYNRDYDDDIQVEEWTEWEVPKRIKCTREAMSRYIRMPELYDDVYPVEDSWMIINELRDLGHRIVYITSTPIGMEGVKYNWLYKWNYIESKKDYIEAEDKSLINFNVLLDDRYENVKNLSGKKGVLFNRPWNLNYNYRLRVNNWEQFYGYINCIY